MKVNTEFKGEREKNGELERSRFIGIKFSFSPYSPFLLAYIIISAIFTSFGYSKKQPSPRIKFDETEFDFGEINQAEKVTHIFKFKNTGDGTLVIEKVKAP